MAGKGATTGAPTFIEKPFIRQDPEGTRLQFECRIASPIQPEVTWFQNDSKVKPGSRHILSNKLDNGSYLCTLDIKDPDRKDAGKFEVKVKTESGDCKATVFSYIG